MKIFRCNHCGNIITKISDKGAPVMCCGEVMSELVANTVDAALEKHVPFLEMIENGVKVSVGEVTHPMEEAHYIEFIVVVTDNENHIVYLKPGENPVKDVLTMEEVIDVYAYCNLHGLWKA